MLCKHIRYLCIYTVRMSPTLNGSSALQCFKHSNAITIHETATIFLLGPVCRLTTMVQHGVTRCIATNPGDIQNIDVMRQMTSHDPTWHHMISHDITWSHMKSKATHPRNPSRHHFRLDHPDHDFLVILSPLWGQMGPERYQKKEACRHCTRIPLIHCAFYCSKILLCTV